LREAAGKGSHETEEVKEEEGYLSLAKFCDAQLRAKEEDPSLSLPQTLSQSNLPLLVLECFLETLIWGKKGDGI